MQNTQPEDFFHPKKTIVIQKPLKRHPASLEYEDKKIPHKRNCWIWPNIPFSKLKWIFIWLCLQPFAKYHSPHQIASKKGNCEPKYIKNASGILGKWKSKIVHGRTYSVQLNSTFYCAKINIYLIVPMKICQIPQFQFGVHHISPNLADIAQHHLLGSILIRHCWRRSQPLLVPL